MSSKGQRYISKNLIKTYLTLIIRHLLEHQSIIASTPSAMNWATRHFFWASTLRIILTYELVLIYGVLSGKYSDNIVSPRFV